MPLVDATQVPPGSTSRTEVCIVGAGAAGISLALALAGRGRDVVVLESGVEDFEARTQELYRGRGEGYQDETLTVSRLRYLGGTTNHFEGQSRPLEEIDFEPQVWNEATGWPISRQEALRHLDDACRLMDLEPGQWEAPGQHLAQARSLTPAAGLQATLFQQARTRFGPRYASELRRLGVTVHLGATVDRVQLADDASHVEHLRVRTLADTGYRVTAGAYVIATGGIESARLLLDSDDVVPAGVGNGHDQVGRYFADHPGFGPVPVVPGDRARTWPGLLGSVAERRPPRAALHRYEALTPTADAQRSFALPGFYVRASDRSPVTTSPFEAGLADLLNPQLGPLPEDVSVIRSLSVGFEPVPDRDNRVSLGSERNELGQRQAVVRWRLGRLDHEHVERLLGVLGQFFAARRLGTLLIDPPGAPWAERTTIQCHHMGTLRMSASPADGVVDANLRLHEVPNLYVAGSAVFPTYGYVNPTLNLVALSLRLAEHLDRELAR